MAELSDILASTAFNVKRTIEDLTQIGDTDAITKDASAVPYPCDGSDYAYRTNGILYDGATGEVDCSGFADGVELFLKWTALIQSASPSGSVFTIAVIIPDGGGEGVDVVAYTKDYTLPSNAETAISNSTVFYVSDVVVANNFKIQVSCSGNDVNILDRSILTIS